MAEQVDSLLDLYAELKSRKSPFESHFEDLARVLYPRRSGFTTPNTEGERLQDEIYDSTPQQAARMLANNVGSQTMPEGEQWVFVRAEDNALNRNDEALAWLSDSENRLRRAFDNPASRFRTATSEARLDLVTFGTAAAFIGEHRSLRGLLFQTASPKDFYIMSDADYNVDGLILSRFFTVRQAVQFFGDKVSEETKQMFNEEKSRLKKIEHIHVIIPRKEAGGGLSEKLPYTSIWIDVRGKKILSESGFHEFPFAVPRWDTTSGEEWGRSPGMIALPDSNTLQAMDETILMAGQKKTEPPLLVPDDGNFNAGYTFPGGLTYYDVELAKSLGRIPIEALDTKGDIPVGLEMQQNRREMVWNAFYRNVLALPPPQGTPMTATEIIARKEEFLRELGDVFGRIEAEFTAKIVERSFNIMLRVGALAEIPEILQGQNIRFEYESPVKKIREQTEALAAQMWKSDLVETAVAAQRPDILDIINFDEYGRFTHDAATIPHVIINSAEAVQQIRDQRTQAQLEAQQAQEMMMMAEGAKMAGGAIKDVAKAMEPPKPAKEKKAA